MYFKMNSREVMEALTLREFSQLCSLIDLGFGKKTGGGQVMAGYKAPVDQDYHFGFVHFNIYNVERLGKHVIVAVDLGHGNVGKIDLTESWEQVKNILEGRVERAA